MSALIYLIRIQLKNMVLHLFRHPAKLIAYVALLAFIVFSVLTGSSNTEVFEADLRLLHGIYLAILLALSVLTLQSGVKSGSTFFGMPDVNLLFVSPIHPKTILQYGLVKQMSSLLLMVMFLLFYSPMLANTFGLQVTDTLLLAAGLAVVLLLAQFISMLIYNFCNGMSSRRTAAKILIYVFAAIPVLAVAASSLQNGRSFEGLLLTVSNPALEWLPVVGWMKGMVFAIIEGNATGVLLFGALTAGSLALSIWLLIRSDSDYYEDVLQSTEMTFQAKQVVEEKQDPMGVPSLVRKIKVKREGIGGGFGASTFFYKHMCEIRRKNRFGLLTTSTLLIAILSLAVAIFIQIMSVREGDPVAGETLIGIILGIQLYLLFLFKVSGDDWLNELKKPYIFLVPAPAFSKLLWACMTSILKPVLDGVLAFLLLWLYLRINIMYPLVAMLVYASYGILFTAVSVLFVRVFGQPAQKGLLTLLFYFALLLLMLPGVAVAGVCLIFLELPVLAAGLILVAGNVLVFVGIIAACRNVLETAELR